MGSFAQARILTTIEIDKPIVLQWKSASGEWVAEFEFVLLQLVTVHAVKERHLYTSSMHGSRGGGTGGPNPPPPPGKSQVSIGFRKIMMRKMKALF